MKARMPQFSEAIARSARRWDLSTRSARAIFWFPVVGAALLIAARLNKDLYRFLLTDDGPIEWAQFALFLGAAVAGAVVSWKGFRSGHRGHGLLFGVFAFGLLFVAGEEISWGQRFLGLTTPEALREINHQEEITVHNINGVLEIINLVVMLTCLAGGTAFLWIRKLRLERFWADASLLYAPPAFLAPAFLVPFLYRLVRYTIWPEDGFTVTKYGEWGELCFAFALFVFAVLNVRQADDVPPGSRPPEELPPEPHGNGRDSDEASARKRSAVT